MEYRGGSGIRSARFIVYFFAGFLCLCKNGFSGKDYLFYDGYLSDDDSGLSHARAAILAV